MRSIALVAALMGGFALAQDDSTVVGGTVPAELLDDFSQTAADSLDDYRGRLVLIELFAYW